MDPTEAPWKSLNPALGTKPAMVPSPGMATAAPWALQQGSIPAFSRPGGLGMLGSASSGGVSILSRNDQSAIQVDPKMPEIMAPMDEATASSSADEQQAPRWRPATKRITTPEDMKKFQASDTLHSYLSFVLFLNHSVSGKKASVPCESSESVQSLRRVLACLSKWVDE